MICFEDGRKCVPSIVMAFALFWCSTGRTSCPPCAAVERHPQRDVFEEETLSVNHIRENIGAGGRRRILSFYDVLLLCALGRHVEPGKSFAQVLCMARVPRRVAHILA